MAKVPLRKAGQTSHATTRTDRKNTPGSGFEPWQKSYAKSHTAFTPPRCPPDKGASSELDLRARHNVVWISTCDSALRARPLHPMENQEKSPLVRNTARTQAAHATLRLFAADSGNEKIQSQATRPRSAGRAVVSHQGCTRLSSVTMVGKTNGSPASIARGSPLLPENVKRMDWLPVPGRHQL